MNNLSWRTAATIAWREARASSGRFVFIVIAVAIGVGAVAGVRGFSAAFRKLLLEDARTLMAADLSVRVFHMPTPREEAALDRFDGQGLEHTWVTETVSAMSSDDASRPSLVSVKAVDPSRYPFYGELELDPPGELAGALTAETMLISADLLIRLNAKIGDRLRLGDAMFRLAAVVLVEPDRMTGTLNIGPRVIVSREGLERSRLIQPGSRAAQRYLFRLPAQGLGIEQARRQLKQVFDHALIADYRETHPTIRRGLDRAMNFLGLVSLVALIVGSLGVAMAMHSHLQQKLDVIAIMKCLGARSSQIIRIYVLQTAGLGAAGSLLGVAVGRLVQSWLPRLIAQYFPFAAELAWQPIAGLQAFAMGMLTTLLFTLPALLAVRGVRPALVFRRDMTGDGLSHASSRRQRMETIRAAAAILAGIICLAAWLGDSLRVGAWFGGGLAVSVLLLALAAKGLLRLLRAATDLPWWKLPPSVRHGVANLYRPGAHTTPILVALGVGVTLTLTAYIVQASVVAQLMKSAPAGMPNLFMVNITQQERDGLLALLGSHPEVEGTPQLYPSVTARLVEVDGVSLDRIQERQGSRRFRPTRGITWQDEQPEDIEIVRGRWWTAEEAASAPPHFVSVRESAAETLDLHVGSLLEWTVGAQSVAARVAAIHRSEAIRPRSTMDFVLSPKALEGLPVIYYGSVRIASGRAPQLQRAIFEQFPSVTAINVADVLEIVQGVVNQIGVVIRFVSALTILAGVVILMSAVMATRFRRVREIAILKTLGATRSRMRRIFSVEFLILGLSAGLLGSLLAAAFSKLLLEGLFDTEFRSDLTPHLVAILGAAAVVNLAGHLASFRLLDRKPIEVLRAE